MNGETLLNGSDLPVGVGAGASRRASNGEGVGRVGGIVVGGGHAPEAVGASAVF